MHAGKGIELMLLGSGGLSEGTEAAATIAVIAIIVGAITSVIGFYLWYRARRKDS